MFRVEPEFRVEDVQTLADEARVAVDRLVEHTRQRTGEHPLPDQFRLELEQGAPGFTALLVWHDQTLAAYGQLGHTTRHTLATVVNDELDAEIVDAATRAVVDAACSAVSVRGGGDLHWWITDTRPQLHERLLHHAEATGFRLDRTLLQMRVALPLSHHDGAAVPTRAFVAGSDELAWLDVNNTAFAAHHEQGAWTIETLSRRQREPWFDPAGFLLHERDGRLAAFCWTKLHLDTTPVMGEIYVVAVHPDFHGLGLGRSLTEAGLDSIAARGAKVGMLYVDEANTAAVSLYLSLGFVVHRRDQAVVATLEPAPPSTPGAAT
jgi:mycothiol synthase